MSKNTQELMGKIALLLQTEEKGSDDSLRKTLQKINARLDSIELRLSNPKSQIQNPQSLHPSQQKLTFIEELVDEIIVNQKIEKACMFETNKPCDNCSMCNSRGF
jgi:cob(I)alamin adenosyltransferase